jgi:hypothetical protein
VNNSLFTAVNDGKKNGDETAVGGMEAIFA